MPTITVTTTQPSLQAEARALADRLQLPYVASTEATGSDYALLLTPEHLSLQQNHSKLLPIAVDFLSNAATYRRQQVGVKKEALARAMGLKANTSPFLVDATAGLGRDSFILACLGFHVTLLERSPIIQALLADGIERAQHHPVVGPIVNRLQLVTTDASIWLQQQTILPDVIYLDPMFPERSKTALVKKEMRIFHAIVGEDRDADQLFQLALTCATKRVVVKRPRLAPPLANQAPSFSQHGNSCRFDIYLR